MKRRTESPPGPWAWRTLLVVLIMGVAAAIFGAATPHTAEPQLDIEHPDFSVAEAETTVSEVRTRIDGLTFDAAVRLEEGLVSEYPLLDGLTPPDLPEGLGLVLFVTGLPLGVGLLGAYILRRGGSRFGYWVMIGAVMGAGQGLGTAGTEYLIRVDAPSALLFPFSVATVVSWIALGIVLFPNLIATFPTGKALTPRWRRLWLMSGISAVLLATPVFGPLWALESRVNPLRLFTADAVLALFTAGIILWGATLLLSLAALVTRFVRSEGEERLQLKWMAVGSVLAGAALVVGNAIQGNVTDEVAGAVATIPIFILLPVILIITVFRHRLYDVDLVISKTVTVAILGGVITGVYAGVIFGFGALIGTEGVGFDLQVAAAVAVAMAFYPARRRAQRLANRLVFGERATPYEVLARFSHRAAETPAEELIERIPQLIVDGTGAVEATLWVRDRDQFRIGAVWPESAFRMPIPAEGGFLDLEADFSLPVHHAGELLGGLSLVKARNESMVPAETELLRSLASGLGVALRNANLTAELKTQVEALEASRDRVLAAADEARRALERDLDSGPQQRLVALKVMLGPIRKQAEQAGAEKTSAILRQLEDEAGSAIRSVREFAGGIYPPLLEAEGLRAAVAQQAQRSGLPVTVDAGDVGRYPREVEAAVYFTILESLQNAAKYANPTEVEVTITDDGGSLAFAIRDDGVGFDPETAPRGSGLSNMEDRIDSVGGRLRVDSHPGAGTSVRGEIPITAQVDV